MTTLLEVTNLSIGHEEELQKNLNFRIKESDIFLIKGNNGVGKSTLLQTILNPEQALHGEVKWGIDKWSFLPQKTNQDFPLSITLGEILESYSLKEEVMSLLNCDLIKRHWSDASGGEKQKTLIATCIQKETEILIMDEPFNHMDKKNIYKTIDLIVHLIREKELKACILSGHIFPKNDISIKELELS